MDWSDTQKQLQLTGPQNSILAEQHREIEQVTYTISSMNTLIMSLWLKYSWVFSNNQTIEGKLSQFHRILPVENGCVYKLIKLTSSYSNILHCLSSQHGQCNRNINCVVLFMLLPVRVWGILNQEFGYKRRPATWGLCIMVEF